MFGDEFFPARCEAALHHLCPVFPVHSRYVPPAARCIYTRGATAAPQINLSQWCDDYVFHLIQSLILDFCAPPAALTDIVAASFASYWDLPTTIYMVLPSFPK